MKTKLTPEKLLEKKLVKKYDGFSNEFGNLKGKRFTLLLFQGRIFESGSYQQ